MPEPSGVSVEDSPVRARGWAARDGHEVEASHPSAHVLVSSRYASRLQPQRRKHGGCRVQAVLMVRSDRLYAEQ